MKERLKQTELKLISQSDKKLKDCTDPLRKQNDDHEDRLRHLSNTVDEIQSQKFQRDKEINRQLEKHTTVDNDLSTMILKNNDDLTGALRRLEVNLIELNSSSLRHMTKNTTINAKDFGDIDELEREESEEFSEGHHDS